ncbi:hypothetical protein ACFVJ4_40355 [Streptomyces sp. NPDC127178]|uniref:hypothetical protein n=1 Tax=unclassified Streptomyces TaxID=2593676 RepID=UPI0036309D55
MAQPHRQGGIDLAQARGFVDRHLGGRVFALGAGLGLQPQSERRRTAGQQDQVLS